MAGQKFAFDGSVAVGDDGTALEYLKLVSVSVNPASIAAGAVLNVDTALTAGSANSGDHVFVEPPITLEAGLVCLAASIPSNDTLRLRLYNPTAGAIDGAALTWKALIVREAS